MHYDMIMRLPRDPSTVVWEWSYGKYVLDTNTAFACIVANVKYVLVGSNRGGEEALDRATEAIAHAAEANKDAVSPDQYTEVHEALLRMTLFGSGPYASKLCKTQPHSDESVQVGDEKASLVEIRPHATLKHEDGSSQEGLFAKKTIKHKEGGTEVCRYYGKLALYGAYPPEKPKDDNAYWFVLDKKVKQDTTVDFLGHPDSKARRINSFKGPDTPFNVAFNGDMSARTGYEIIVRTLRDIPKV
jgi:hypothetical protein